MNNDNKEQELEELRERAEYGRKAQITLEVTKDFILKKRAFLFGRMESGRAMTGDEALDYIRWLVLLKEFENEMQTYIQMGEIAEKELIENV